MDEEQIAKPGDKMKSVYDDVQVHAEGTADEAPCQLRRTYLPSKKNAGQAASTFETQLGSFVQERPIAVLLAAASVGSAQFRLPQHR